MKLLLENIKEPVQLEEKPVAFRSGKEMAGIKTIKDAFLIIQDELIRDFGRMDQHIYINDDFLVEMIVAAGSYIPGIAIPPYIRHFLPPAKKSSLTASGVYFTKR